MAEVRRAHRARRDCGSLRGGCCPDLANTEATENVVKNTLDGLPFQSIERAKDSSDRF